MTKSGWNMVGARAGRPGPCWQGWGRQGRCCNRGEASHSTQMVALGRPHANGSMCRREAGWGRWPSVGGEGEASGDRWNLGQNASPGQPGYLPHPAKSHCQIARWVTAVLLAFNISNLTPLPSPRFVPLSPATPDNQIVCHNIAFIRYDMEAIWKQLICMPHPA